MIRKISQIDKKEPKNKFVDNMRSMITSLTQSINKISQIDQKIAQAELINKFLHTNQFCNKEKKAFILMNI